MRTLRCSRAHVLQEASVKGQMGRSPCSNACQVVSAFPLHKFRVFVLMELIISPFPLLPDVSCLPPSLPFAGCALCVRLISWLWEVSDLSVPPAHWDGSTKPCVLSLSALQCPRRHLKFGISAPPDQLAVPWKHRQIWIE